MKATKAFFALIVTAALMAVSCEKDDKKAIEPVLGDIVFCNLNNESQSITTCSPGDRIKATVTYKQDGKYFKFSGNNLSFGGLEAINDSTISSYNGIAGQEPFVSFIVKDTVGTFTINFSGQIELLAGQDLWGNRLKSSGSIKVVRPSDKEEEKE